MSGRARILLVALLAVFAVSTVVHVANATTMSVKMVLADGGPMGMAECESGGDEQGAACNIVCIYPYVANLVAEETLASLAAPSYATWAICDSGARAPPPDPHPPRFLILS